MKLTPALLFHSGDPIAIAAALAAHEAKKRKKKILEADPEILPTNLKCVSLRCLVTVTKYGFIFCAIHLSIW